MDYRYTGLRDLATALRDGRTTPLELAYQAMDALDTVGRRYNAVATMLPDRARRDAERGSQALAHGQASPLCGIPYAVKDIFAAHGGPTTWGSQSLAARVIDEDAAAVERLGAYGSVLVAKLALSEFAGGGRPAAPGASMHGQGRNPWDPRRYSGGSSSGSGIAVALGLVPYALGTETGGSTIGPAAFCGVTGVRTTSGSMPLKGVMTLSWTLDKLGVLARSADDCATVLTHIADPGDFEPLAEAEGDQLVQKIRVAWLDAELDEAHPSIRSSLSTGVREFLEMGPTVVDTGLPRDLPFIDPLELIVRVEGAFGLRTLLESPDFAMSDQRQQRTLLSGLDVPVAEYLHAVRVAVPAAVAAFDAVFQHADVILSASRTTIAPSLTEERPPRDPSKMSDLVRAAANLAGVPGVSFPCGLSEEGLPVGLQLVGPRGSDAVLLALAAAFQRSTGHHKLRPPEPAPG